MEPREAATLVKKVAEAVAYAHVEGVIHRDLKPGNILLDKDGTPRVTDFGLAKQVEGKSQGLTATGQVLGTPSYMPPEQARGDNAKIGPLADVYSLGAVLYCVLTGRPPFQAANPLDTLRQVLDQDPVPPRVLNRNIPVDLNTICLKCLQKEPQRRYAGARSGRRHRSFPGRQARPGSARGAGRTVCPMGQTPACRGGVGGGQRAGRGPAAVRRLVVSTRAPRPDRATTCCRRASDARRGAPVAGSV